MTRANNVMNNLLFIRQYLFCKNSIEINLPETFAHTHKFNSNYSIYYHTALNFATHSTNGTQICVLGDLFDFRNPDKTNSDIALSLSKLQGIEELYNEVYFYSGRYIIITEISGDIYVFGDSKGSMGITYYQNETDGITAIATDPNTLSFSIPEITKTTNNEILHFFEKELPNRGVGDEWIGDDTIYHNVKALLPSYSLKISTNSVQRYWPRKELLISNLRYAVKNVAKYYTGTMQALSNRSKLAIPITAGYDSRLVMAATTSAGIKDVIYFVDKMPDLSMKSPDITIGKKLTELIGEKHYIYNLEDVSQEFTNIYFKNCFLARKERVGEAFIFYRHLDANTHTKISAASELARSPRGSISLKKITPEFIAAKLSYSKSPYAIKKMCSYANDCIHVQKHYNINTCDLLFIEQWLGNRSKNVDTAYDIGINTIDPCASHYLYELFLGLDPEYRTKQDNTLTKEVIKILDPRLLSLPFNPTSWHQKIAIYIYRKLRIREFVPQKFSDVIRKFLSGI